ncbi:Meiosis 1 arrest protein [Nymphon striatum]|nr:Meiosis 1 arrest protein [Nymphon striatum]
MKMSNNSSREVFTKQPTHYILIDFSTNPSSIMLEDLQKSLQFLFTTITVMKGSNRIPGIGIGLIDAFSFESIIAIDETKGSYARLMEALINLRKFIEDKMTKKQSNKKANFETAFIIAMHEATTQFLQFNNKMMSKSPTYNKDLQLQLTILTFSTEDKSRQCITQALAELDMGKLKKVQIVSVKEAISPDNSICSESSQQSKEFDDIVETVEINGDGYKLDSFFRAWLQNATTDKEHLHLILPSLQHVIKCDIHEQLLDLTCFPFSQHLSMNVDPGSLHTVQYFHALRIALLEKEEAALLKKKITGRKPINEMSEYYVMIPGPSESIMLKKVATFENILPLISTKFNEKSISSEIKQEIQIPSHINMLLNDQADVLTCQGRNLQEVDGGVF